MIDRRRFMIGALGGALSVISGSAGASVIPDKFFVHAGKKTRVSLVKTSDRAEGIKKAIDLLGINPVKGRDVLIKPNFNTADPYPASTHNDTLISLISHLKGMGSKKITIGERSGPPDTADVLREKRIIDLSKKMGAGLINFEDLPPDSWIKVRYDNIHWRDGFYVARPVLEAECIVATCCLKTHAYGGVFTMSLKLGVGITHKKNMRELHTSFLSIRKMIAEINLAYVPSLILLDGIEAFADGGPAKGERKRADVIIAGSDRVAVDATGLAVLKEIGSNRAIMEKKIFGQEQIARAVELGIGVNDPSGIDIITGDEKSRRYSERLLEILSRG